MYRAHKAPAAQGKTKTSMWILAMPSIILISMYVVSSLFWKLLVKYQSRELKNIIF